MDFGIPKQRRRKVEFHEDQPVVRMLAVSEEGQRSKFVMNTKAAEMLGLGTGAEEKVSISFDGGLYLANTTGMDVEQYRVTKNKPYAFSNSKLREYMIKSLDLDTTNDIDFILDAIDNDGYRVAEMSILSTEHGVDESNESNETPESPSYVPQMDTYTEAVVEETTETNEW
jgi:hypothetical protein